MRILLLLAHSVEEYDQLRLFSELGHDVFSIGGYIDPAKPHDDKRPALPNVKHFPELQAIVDSLGTDDNLEAAKYHLPSEILDWTDVIICHHKEHTWLIPQWDRIKHKRVIWRTVGQSVENNEQLMTPLRKDGLQIVRYSPCERNIPSYCGEDALIRFYKDRTSGAAGPGEEAAVINFSQNFQQRDPYTNWKFWADTTVGLNRKVFGPGSDNGEVSTEEMQELLRSARVYLYTGTQPASYTLGLIEAMMTGIPVVSIGPVLYERLSVWPIAL